jgi:hypothetical protein
VEPTKRRAACVCGQLSLVCEGDPVRVSMCHCHACQQRTGSIFGVQARFRHDQVSTREGRSSEYVRTGDAGGRVTYQFCPACGATLCWELDGLPGFVAVPVGAFADAAFPEPTFSIYEARKHGWAATPEGVEHVD